MNLKADLLELLNEFSATGSIEVNKKPMSLLNEDDMKIVKRITTSKITFGDVCGMNQAKEYLKLCLSYCTNANHVKSKGVLLFGVSVYLKTEVSVRSTVTRSLNSFQELANRCFWKHWSEKHALDYMPRHFSQYH